MSFLALWFGGFTGGITGAFAALTLHLRAEARRSKYSVTVPGLMEIHRFEDGLVYALGHYKGEPFMLTLPRGYNPSEDDGKILQQSLIEWLNSRGV